MPAPKNSNEGKRIRGRIIDKPHSDAAIEGVEVAAKSLIFKNFDFFCEVFLLSAVQLFYQNLSLRKREIFSKPMLHLDAWRQ